MPHVTLGSLPSGVTQRGMGDSARKYTCQFCLAFCLKDQALVDVLISTRQGESLNGIGIDYANRDGEACIGVLRNRLANAIDVFDDDQVVNQPRGALTSRAIPLPSAFSLSVE